MQFGWMNYQVENYQAFFYSTDRQISNLCLASALSVHIFRGPWLGRLLGSEKKRSGTSFFSHRFWHVGILKGVGVFHKWHQHFIRKRQNSPKFSSNYFTTFFKTFIVAYLKIEKNILLKHWSIKLRVWMILWKILVALWSLEKMFDNF